MFRSIFPVIFTFVLSCHAGTVLEKLAIKNGPVAPEGQFPYQIEIYWNDGTHSCGGSIINKRYILTAAHCVYMDSDDSSTSSPNYYDYDYENTSTGTPDNQRFGLENSSTESSDYGEYHEYSGLLDPKDIQIRAGVNKLDDENGIVYEVEKIIMHENYTTNPNVYHAADIALIRVTEDIAFNDRIQPVKLASSKHPEELLPVGAPVVVTGWGYTQACMEVTDETTNDLRMAKMTIYDFDKCQNEYSEELNRIYNQTDDSEVLAWGPDRGMICCIGHTHTCKGDSGGPIVDERGVQVGIVSFGLEDLPDVNTDVWFYSEWIANNSKITEN